MSMHTLYKHFCVNYKSDWAKGGNPCSKQGFH